MSEVWDNFEISLVVFYAKYHIQIMLLFVYTTTCKRFVIFTYRYFKLSWNTTALSQSNCSNFSCSSITQVKFWKFHVYWCYNSVKFDIHFLGLPWEYFFGVTTDHLLHQALEKCKKECNMLYFKLNYPGTRFLSTENKNYSMSWWVLS